MNANTALTTIEIEISDCFDCERLVKYRESVASTKRKSFREETYWGRAVPGFGDSQARFVVVGLAPAAHGANRTGRIFTGDRSGDWLYESLHRYGFANQPESHSRSDGLTLRDAYVTCSAHCVPPNNQPSREELSHCRQKFLKKELLALQKTQVILCLGAIAYQSVLSCLTQPGGPRPPAFRHGAEYQLPLGPTLLLSYHCSQQNTFTGKLTRPLFYSVFERARDILDSNGRS